MANVRGFGAVGDGRADDTAAIQHAVDQGDGIIRLNRGTYRVTKPILLDTTRRGYVSVQGDGVARLRMDGPGAALRVVGDHQGTAQPSSVKTSTWDRERMPQISGIEILGGHPEADGIELQKTMQTTIDKVAVRKCRFGIRLVERNRNFILANSHIYDCGDTGVFFDRCNLHQTIITGNHISYCKRAGIRQRDGDVHNIQITGNDIEYNSGLGDASAEILLEADESAISEYTISGNTIQATRDAPGANILISGAEGNPPQLTRLISITGNVIGHRQHNIVLAFARSTTIAGNTIYGGGKMNVWIRDSQQVVLNGNTFTTRPANWKSTSNDGILIQRSESCLVMGGVLHDAGVGQESRGGSILLEDCRRCSVSQMHIINPKYRGIDLSSCRACRISDNTIDDDRRPLRMIHAIRVEGGRGNVVQNNLTGRALKTPIALDDSNHAASGNHDLLDAKQE